MFLNHHVLETTIQIKNILAPGVADPHGTWHSCKLDIKNCSPIQLRTMQGSRTSSSAVFKLFEKVFYSNLSGFGLDFRVQFLSALNGVGSSLSRGLFIDSCYAHCQTETQETWLRADSPTLSKTVSNQHECHCLCHCSSNYTNSFHELEYADHCKGSWRLVFRPESVPEDRLSLPVQPDMPQPHFRSERQPRMRNLLQQLRYNLR